MVHLQQIKYINIIYNTPVYYKDNIMKTIPELWSKELLKFATVPHVLAKLYVMEKIRSQPFFGEYKPVCKDKVIIYDRH